ncbi:nucleotide-diphospho-sugar transferase [Podospora australis]|uniref:glycogenin glucosyltransferase n=1 Tax=Podospora australis TaxID=1536484 RepID=A0AAN7ALC8_9PEZI|nr:nucleotide-diphospho-sugar transferase [Podospora australis]
MASHEGEDVYASLLLTDTYLPGALVLAHSLRDAGTRKKLVILVTPETVSQEVITQLETVYDQVIPVETIRNAQPENLYLMDRPDLHSAFTKIQLWKQTQFRRIIYIDADVVAYRAVDELFHLPHAFSAAPDIGWPDLFNTGVMALTPNMADYYALLAMAERGISFDGADQGLLNMHFKNSFNRLSFTYNVTPSAHYQYVPAYKHHQHSINLIHFIGSSKPWVQGRGQSTGSSPYDQMIGKWWAVYDGHYGGKNASSAPEIVRYFVKGEFHPTMRYVVPVGEPNGQQHNQPPNNPPQSTGSSQDPDVAKLPEGTHTEQPTGQGREYSAAGWDASRNPPPTGSKPEALNFPQTHYEMSSDATPFVAPERYPSPPKDMWYSVPNERPAPHSERPRAIFPWETNQPQPTRVFGPSAPSSPQGGRSRSGSTMTDTSTVGRSSGPHTPPGPATRDAPSGPTDMWSSFPRSNAWDEVPQINRYVDNIQKHRRTRSQGLGVSPPAKQANQEAGSSAPWKQRKGSRVTDFPSEDDRPSLPVTPAPIRRPKFWGVGGPGGGEGEGEEQLPVAEGVPPQAEWDPVAQLQKLAQHQHEVLQKLGSVDIHPDETLSTEGKEIPSRPLPFGSEDVRSPTYVAPSPPVVSPRPIKPAGLSPASKILAAEPEIVSTNTTSTIVQPSYQGPGASFEKGEDYPTYETPALPTDEDRDILDT